MRRTYGVPTVFLAWLCIPGSGALGLLASEFLSLHYVEGPQPLSSVYGVSEIVILWILVAVAVLGMIPVGMSVSSPNPRSLLYGWAGGMGVAALLLLPDDLGRIHAIALIPGAILFWLGGYVLGQETPPTDAAPRTSLEAVAPEAERPVATPAGLTASQPGPVRSAARGKARGNRECPWCSTVNKAGAQTCGGCGASLKAGRESLEMEIPGVTVVSPKLLEYQRLTQSKAVRKPSILAAIMGARDPRIMDPVDADPSAFEAPSRDVKLEMARLARDVPTTPETAPDPAAGRPGDER